MRAQGSQYLWCGGTPENKAANKTRCNYSGVSICAKGKKEERIQIFSARRGPTRRPSLNWSRCGTWYLSSLPARQRRIARS